MDIQRQFLSLIRLCSTIFYSLHPLKKNFFEGSRGVLGFLTNKIKLPLRVFYSVDCSYLSLWFNVSVVLPATPISYQTLMQWTRVPLCARCRFNEVSHILPRNHFSLDLTTIQYAMKAPKISIHF